MRYLRVARVAAAVVVLLAGGLLTSGCGGGDTQQLAVEKVSAVKGPLGWAAGPIIPVCAVITGSCNDPSVSRLWYAPQHTTPEQACTVAYRWTKHESTSQKLSDCARWLRTHPNVNPRKWGGALMLDPNHWVNSTQNMGASVNGYMYAVGVGY